MRMGNLFSPLSPEAPCDQAMVLYRIHKAKLYQKRTICFTICLCLEFRRAQGAPQNQQGLRMFIRYVFTICLFISPDLQPITFGTLHQSPITTICFTICLFISPDLDGYRAPKMKYHQSQRKHSQTPPNQKKPEAWSCLTMPCRSWIDPIPAGVQVFQKNSKWHSLIAVDATH